MKYFFNTELYTLYLNSVLRNFLFINNDFAVILYKYICVIKHLILIISQYNKLYAFFYTCTAFIFTVFYYLIKTRRLLRSELEVTHKTYTCNTLGKKAFLNVNTIFYVITIYKYFSCLIYIFYDLYKN